MCTFIMALWVATSMPVHPEDLAVEENGGVTNTATGAVIGLKANNIQSSGTRKRELCTVGGGEGG